VRLRSVARPTRLARRSRRRRRYAAAVGAVNSGPLGANGVPATVPGANGHPMPFNPLKDVAFHALSNAFQVGYLLCGIAGVVAALIAGIFLAGRHHDDHFTEAA
jgi:hypothetical protein